MRLGWARNDFIFNYICDKQWVGVLLLGTYLLGLHGEVARLGRIFLPQVPVLMSASSESNGSIRSSRAVKASPTFIRNAPLPVFSISLCILSVCQAILRNQSRTRKAP